jgi:hypothetical protein
MRRKTDTIMANLARIRLSVKAQASSRAHYNVAVRTLRLRKTIEEPSGADLRQRIDKELQ